MAESPRQFWARIGLGKRRGQRPTRLRQPRARINVVMWEGCINRRTRGYSFPETVSEDAVGTPYGKVSVVRGTPGMAAVSAVWYDEDTNKLRCKFVGQHGRTYQSACDAYAARHSYDTKPAVVVAVDASGTLLYSVDLFNA